MNRWIVGARPRTLPAAAAPVIVGTVAAISRVPECPGPAPGTGGCELVVDPGVLRWGNAGLALVVALALQVATNYANDYSDGRRGTDDPRARTGPARLVGSGLATAAEVKVAMLAAFGVALVAGFGLVLTVGWELVPVGVAAVAAGWFYTGGPRPYGYAGFGEVFVFVFFGLVATVGSTYVQVERVTWLSVGCGVMLGALATALLVTNNLRDIPSDAAAGKRTLAVRLGDQRTRILYAVLMTLPFVVLPLVAGLSGRPVAAAAYVALPLSTWPVRDVLSGSSGVALVPVLAATARAELVFALALAVGLLVAP